MGELLFWHGMGGKFIDIAKFIKDGGTELAAMSTTRNEEVARKYAGDAGVIFKFKTQDLSQGVSLRYLSVFPGEDEYLYGPGTYLRYDKHEVAADGKMTV